MSRLNVCTITYNCGRERINPSVFARHLLSISKSKPPDLLILCLQEIAPISYAFLGGSYLHPYYHEFRDAVSLAAASLENATYTNVMARNVGMTAIMAFVLHEHVERIKWIKTAGVGVGMREMGNKGAVGLRFGFLVDGVSRAGAGAGNGNKEEEEEEEEEEKEIMEISVVAVHLAPMEHAVDRRNEDWKSIVQRLVFIHEDGNTRIRQKKKPTERRSDDDRDESASLLRPSDTSTSTSAFSPTAAAAAAATESAPLASGLFTPTSHLIFAGDLNYRTSDVKPTPSDFQSYPQPAPAPAPGDPSDGKHFSALLKNDQLRREMKAGRTCHGLQEAPIDFPPTYKYSERQRALVDKSNDTNDATTNPDLIADELESRWDWAPHRWPSWCDRILYLDLPRWTTTTTAYNPFSSSTSFTLQINQYTCLPLMATSDHRPVILSLSIPFQAIPPLPPRARNQLNNKYNNNNNNNNNHNDDDDDDDNDDVRTHPPFEIDPEWREKRARARQWEIVVGLMMYLATTGEGKLILLTTVMVVGVGGWWGWSGSGGGGGF